jgi:hypothetical protein
MSKSLLSRRAFLQTTLAAAGATLASNTIRLDAEPTYTAQGSSAPSDRIHFGIVGVGMEGSSVLATAVALPGTECVAAADLYDGRHILAREIVGKPIKTTRRYQELLDDKSIDAILITGTNRSSSTRSPPARMCIAKSPCRTIRPMDSPWWQRPGRRIASCRSGPSALVPCSAPR